MLNTLDSSQQSSIQMCLFYASPVISEAISNGTLLLSCWPRLKHWAPKRPHEPRAGSLGLCHSVTIVLGLLRYSSHNPSRGLAPCSILKRKGDLHYKRTLDHDQDTWRIPYLSIVVESIPTTMCHMSASEDISTTTSQGNFTNKPSKDSHLNFVS